MSINRSFVKLFLVFATGLLAGQVCQALPAPASPWFNATLESRDLPPGLAGDSQRPEAQDLVTANWMVDSNQPSQVSHFYRYTTTILGFLQRDQAWVQNWFATSDEVIKLSAVKPLADDGNTYVMKYHEDDGKRYGVEVQPDWAKNSFFSPTNTAHDFRFEGPWWPWALLQAALDGGDNTLNLESIVLALSGEKLISPEVKKDKKYWDDYLVEANRTPMWISRKGGWYSVLGSKGEKKRDRTVTLGYVFNDAIRQEDHKFEDIKGEIESIHVLEGLPSVPELRKGETNL